MILILDILDRVKSIVDKIDDVVYGNKLKGTMENPSH